MIMRGQWFEHACIDKHDIDGGSARENVDAGGPCQTHFRDLARDGRGVRGHAFRGQTVIGSEDENFRVAEIRAQRAAHHADLQRKVFDAAERADGLRLAANACAKLSLQR